MDNRRETFWRPSDLSKSVRSFIFQNGKTIFNDPTLIGKVKTEDKNSAHLFHLLCINASQGDYMHNKCMELHTKIEFSKPAHRRCDAHVISQPVLGQSRSRSLSLTKRIAASGNEIGSRLQGSGAVVCSRSVKRDAKTRTGGWGKTGPPFLGKHWMDNIDLNQMSHQYVSGVFQNDWFRNDPWTSVHLIDRSEDAKFELVWVIKRSILLFPVYITLKQC